MKENKICNINSMDWISAAEGRECQFCQMANRRSRSRIPVQSSSHHCLSSLRNPWQWSDCLNMKHRNNIPLYTVFCKYSKLWITSRHLLHILSSADQGCMRMAASFKICVPVNWKRYFMSMHKSLMLLLIFLVVHTKWDWWCGGEDGPFFLFLGL